jgi:hypothetical protein
MFSPPRDEVENSDFTSTANELSQLLPLLRYPSKGVFNPTR